MFLTYDKDADTEQFVNCYKIPEIENNKENEK